MVQHRINFTHHTATLTVLIALALSLSVTPARAFASNPDELNPTAESANHQGTAAEMFVDEDTTDLDPLAPEAQGRSTRNVPITGNPYSCMAHTAQVHGSYSFASLHAKNYGCTLTPTQSIVGAEIMKAGWAGLWHRIVSMQEEKAASSVDVNAKRICSDSSMQSYRGNGYHRVVYGDTWYIARTSSNTETRFACNAHAA